MRVLSYRMLDRRDFRSGYGGGEMSFGITVGLIILVVVGFWIERLVDSRRRVIRDMADHVAEVLHSEYLEPIEDRVYVLDHAGKKAITLDSDLLKNLIEYVRTASRLLGFFHLDWWSQLDEYRDDIDDKTEEELARRRKRRDGSAEYILWRALEEKFIEGKPTSIAGQDLCDPFAFWVKELYHCLDHGGLQTVDDIVAAEVCDHGFIIFKTPTESFNINYKAGRFRCAENCTTARDVLTVRH
jgi:hypothetical protein